jgi:S1-C subfamily serine protease
MQRMPRSLVTRAPALVLVCVGALGPTSLESPPQEPAELRPGTPLEIEFDAEREAGRLVRIQVPERAVGLALSTAGATIDVELYARHGTAPSLAHGQWDAAAAGAWLDEELLLSRGDLLQPGAWYVWIAAGYDATWEPGAARVRCTVRADVLVPEPLDLPLDVPQSVRLDPSAGLWAAYRVRVPAGASLRVEAASDLADVNLAATSFPDGLRFETPLAGAATTRAFERLVLPARPLDEAENGARDVYLHLYAPPSAPPGEAIAARVLATASLGPEPTLAPDPRIPEPGGATALERAVAATINLISPLGGGSGVVVSADGWVLSNAHVVGGVEPEGAARAGSLPAVCAGFTLDPTLPAIETCGLELVDVRRDLDLALLRITSRIDGRPLAPGTVFPHAPLAPAAPRASLGTPLWVLGYPMTGGSGSVLTITLTRGVVSGYAREAEGLVYKTDAAVHAGTSGGACVDADGALIGLPAASIADANAAGGLGYVLPIALVPAAWRERIDH